MLSDWTCWCSVLAKPLVSLVLRLWSLIVLSGASFVLSDWTCWCSVLAKPLVSLVLRLWSLIVLSGASFVLSDWTCWCSVLAKPLVSLVLRLWSLIVDFLQSADGDKDSRNWPTLPWTGCLPKVFFGTFPGALFGPFWCLCWCSVCGLSLCFFWRFYFALLHQSTLNNARFTGMSFGV